MGINTAIVGIFFVLIGVSYGKLFRQDYYFDQRVSGWLKHQPIPAKFEDAVVACHSEGAIIASPLDEDFRKVLSEIIVDSRVQSLFTGISNVYAKSEFQSLEGVPLSNICTSWSVEPNETRVASENTCITMNGNGTVTAGSCLDRRPFVCYKKTGVVLNECGPVDAGFVLNNRTGSCYKAVNELAVWSDAFKICARQGAHLAIVNSETEAEVLWGLAKKLVYQTPIAPSEYINSGFHAWGNPRLWITVHGQSLSDAGYAKWGPGLLGTDPEDRCGTLYAKGKAENGVLDDANCINKRKFICEIDPKASW